jgi:preprotein translocase subunit SecG
MQTVLLVVQIMLAVALIGTILIQRTAQDGGGLMGGGSTMGGLFTARGSANVLTRTTSILATLFILNSLALGYIASSQHATHSLLDQITPAAQPSAPQPSTAPPSAPAQPAQPAVPQVPLAK